MKKENAKTNRRKKKIVPEKNGAPMLFTKETSKADAIETVPGITPTCINPSITIEITPVKKTPKRLVVSFTLKYTM